MQIDTLLAKPFYDAHEWCHYIAARVLDVPATRHRYCVEVLCEDWRMIPIMLAPSIAGLAFGVGFIILVLTTHKWQYAMSGIAFNIGWQAIALRDLSCAWYLLVRRRWPNDNEGFQGIGKLMRRVADGNNDV